MINIRKKQKLQGFVFSDYKTLRQYWDMVSYFFSGFWLKLLCVLKNWLDQSKYLSNCTPTPPLIQQKSTDNKLRLELG